MTKQLGVADQKAKLQATQEADKANQRADQEQQWAELFATKLRNLGIEIE
jgi:hypothetical protein